MSLNPIFCHMNGSLLLSWGDTLCLPTECWLSGLKVEIKLTDTPPEILGQQDSSISTKAHLIAKKQSNHKLIPDIKNFTQRYYHIYTPRFPGLIDKRLTLKKKKNVLTIESPRSWLWLKRNICLQGRTKSDEDTLIRSYVAADG